MGHDGVSRQDVVQLRHGDPVDIVPFLVAQPWSAFIPAVVIGLATWRFRGRAGWIAALGWALYGLYELAMQHRWLCTGECNIRVDLLRLHPLLLILTAIATVSLVQRSRRR